MPDINGRFKNVKKVLEKILEKIDDKLTLSESIEIHQLVDSI